jgi:hypothetical protein
MGPTLYVQGALARQRSPYGGCRSYNGGIAAVAGHQEAPCSSCVHWEQNRLPLKTARDLWTPTAQAARECRDLNKLLENDDSATS